MKRTLIFSFFTAATTSYFTAQNLKDTVALSEIEITIEQPGTDISRTRNISTLQSNQIDNLPARSINEALAYTPGVDIRQRGIGGGQADIGIRGGSFEQTLILLNGIKLSDPQTGHHAMAIPVSLSAIKQMDVLKGPATHLFGQNAYAGAVNVITNLPSSKKLDVELFGGSFGTRGGNFYAALPFRKTRQAISLSHIASDGHWYNSDFKVSNLFYEGAWNPSANHELRWMGAYSSRDLGANGYYTNRFPDQWESIQTTLASLQYNYSKDRVQLMARSYFRQNDDEFRLVRDRSDALRNVHQSRVGAVELKASYSSVAGKTSIGSDSRQESIISSNLGNHERVLTGLYVQHDAVLWQRTNLKAALFSNYYSEYGWKHFPGFELAQQIADHSTLFGNIGYSFRIPTYTELYYNDPATTSNPELKPEEALAYELGYRFNSGGFKAELNFFRRETNNLIDYYRPASTASVNTNLWTPRNVVSVQFQGVEVATGYTFKKMAVFIQPQDINVSYNFIDASVKSDPLVETRYSLTALRHQFISGVTMRVHKTILLTATWRYLQRQNLSAYHLLDARCNVGVHRKLNAFIEVNNITNTEYVEAGYVQMPGRWFKAGLTWRVF